MFSLEEQEPNFVALRHFVFFRTFSFFSSELSLFLSLSSELFPQERERERGRERMMGWKNVSLWITLRILFTFMKQKMCVLFSGSEESKFPFFFFLLIFLFLSFQFFPSACFLSHPKNLLINVCLSFSWYRIHTEEQCS